MLASWIGILVLVSGCGLLYLVTAAFLSRFVARRLENGDQRLEVETEDGWTLIIHHSAPRGSLTPHPTPVILAHGLMMNRSSWALSTKGCLSQALANRGFSVYVAEYRGDRSSTPPRDQGRKAKWKVQVDDYAFRDVPALIAKVQDHSGSKRVHWVGHSMGGILLYRYIHRLGDQAIDRVVTLGSPVDFGRPPRIMVFLEGLVPRMRPLTPMVLVRTLSWLILPILWVLPRFSRFMGADPKLLSRAEIITLLSTATEDVSVEVLSWFLDRARAKLPLFPGDDGMRFFRRPLLVVAGLKDNVAPPASVRPAYEGVTSEDKEWCLLGDQSSSPGAPAFSHCDLISGVPALEHVLPRIDRWLRLGTEP